MFVCLFVFQTLGYKYSKPRLETAKIFLILTLDLVRLLRRLLKFRRFTVHCSLTQRGIKEGERERTSQRQNDYRFGRFLFFFCYCFFSSRSFPHLRFSPLCFPTYHWLWACVCVCAHTRFVCVWSHGINSVVTHWCDQGHRGT